MRLSLFIFIIGFLVLQPLVFADAPEALIQWTDSTPVGGFVAQNDVGLHEFIDAHLLVPKQNTFSITDQSSSNVADFSKTLTKALQGFEQEGKGTLRIIVNAHGSPGGFWINANTEIQYSDFVNAIALAIKAAKGTPANIELYVDSCFSGSMVKDLNESLAQNKIRGVTVKAWMGSKADHMTMGTDFTDALNFYAKINDSLNPYLRFKIECDGSEKTLLAQKNYKNVNFWQSLGGLSQSQFWTNKAQSFRLLTQPELEALLKTDDNFLQERVLDSLIQNKQESADQVPFVISIMQDATKPPGLRMSAMQYLSGSAATDPITSALKKAALPGVPAGEFDSFRYAAIGALGAADPDSYEYFMTLYKNTDDRNLKGALLMGLGNTKRKELVPLLEQLALSDDLSFASTAGQALAHTNPTEAISFISKQLENPKITSEQRVYAYGILGAAGLSLPEEVSEILANEYSKQSDPTEKFEIMYSAYEMALSEPSTRSALKSNLLKIVSDYIAQNKNSKDEDVLKNLKIYIPLNALMQADL